MPDETEHKEPVAAVPDGAERDLPEAAQRALAEAEARRNAAAEQARPKELGGRGG